MSNSPTLPPVPGSQRNPTPLPSLALSVESDTRLQAALAASARAEASLSGLFRAIQSLGAGVGGAREANESLTTELEALREMLGSANEQQQLFQVKIEQLELVLDRTRKEHLSERTYLIDQQDLFLVKLLDEQEVELKRRDTDLEVLRGRLLELERRQIVTLPPPFVSLPSLTPQPVQRVEPSESVAPPSSELERAERAELERTAQKLAEDRERARETVSRLQAQRDEAQSAVARISKERDEALHQIHRLKAELGGPRIPLSTRPPPADPRRDSAQARALGAALTLDQLETEARLSRPTAAPASARGASASSGEEPVSSLPVISVLSPPPSSPRATPLSTRLSPPPTRLSPPPSPHSPPPEELRRALTAPPSMLSSASSQPPLKQKPDASTRPLVGYSVANEGIEAEHLEGVRLSSRPVPPSGTKR
ncbi:MAG: hypothetical protein ABW061_20705 [Polyangiaceae bacterium]